MSCSMRAPTSTPGVAGGPVASGCWTRRHRISRPMPSSEARLSTPMPPLGSTCSIACANWCRRIHPSCTPAAGTVRRRCIVPARSKRLAISSIAGLTSTRVTSTMNPRRLNTWWTSGRTWLATWSRGAVARISSWRPRSATSISHDGISTATLAASGCASTHEWFPMVNRSGGWNHLPVDARLPCVRASGRQEVRPRGRVGPAPRAHASRPPGFSRRAGWLTRRRSRRFGARIPVSSRACQKVIVVKWRTPPGTIRPPRCDSCWNVAGP